MTTKDAPLTEVEQAARGQEIARVLQLKPARDNGKRYKPERFNTTHGTKTALGLYRTLKHLLASPAPVQPMKLRNLDWSNRNEPLNE